MVRPAMVTVARETRKMRLTPRPLMVRFPAPGPRIRRLFETTSSPPVRVMVAGAGREKVIVSPLQALLRAARREPATLSAVVVTARVPARRWAGAAANRAREAARAKLGERSLIFMAVPFPGGLPDTGPRDWALPPTGGDAKSGTVSSQAGAEPSWKSNRGGSALPDFQRFGEAGGAPRLILAAVEAVDPPGGLEGRWHASQDHQLP